MHKKIKMIPENGLLPIARNGRQWDPTLHNAIQRFDRIDDTVHILCSHPIEFIAASAIAWQRRVTLSSVDRVAADHVAECHL